MIDNDDPVSGDRGRYAELARQFPTDAKKFTAEALKLAEEAAAKVPPARTADFLYRQRKQIGSIARDIERMKPQTEAQFKAAVTRLEKGAQLRAHTPLG